MSNHESIGDVQEVVKELLDALHGNKGKEDLLSQTTLTEKQLNVLELRFGFYDGIEWSFGDIGNKYDISRQAARKLFLKAQKKLSKLA